MVVGISLRAIMAKYFSQKDVLELYIFFKHKQIKVWLDGGWGVDALLGQETRFHQDLDIVIQQKDLFLCCKALESRGYSEITRDDTCAWNFVLGDNAGREIDIHVISIDNNGNGIYGPAERGIFYPVESLMGIGSINGVEINCLNPEYQVQSHTGYNLKDKDFKDVFALCKKFNIPLPPEYRTQKHLK